MIKNILIIDDNPFNRDLIADMIAENGFNVHLASSGKEALDKVKTTKFSIILMDLIMPGMDGFETTKKIRSMEINTPIIAVSAMSLKQDRIKSLEAGCNDFLPKPVEPNELKKLIDKYTNSSTLENQQQNLNQQIQQTSSYGINYSDFLVLLIEENDALNKKYSNLLKNIGFKVKSVPNGTQALRWIKDKTTNFQIIISNIFTPGIDAIALLIITKREQPDILMFIYTKTYDADTFQLAIQQGVDGIIPQSQFEDSAIKMIEASILQANEKNSKARNATAVKQISNAHAQLINIGCQQKCNFCEINHSTLNEAGGDIARCRKFNLEGRCGIVLADVAGHDVLSSYFSAIFLGMLMTAWDKHQDPMTLLKTINFELNRFNYDRMHICTTAILWDRQRKKMKIATAGNPGGIIVKRNHDGTLNFKELQGGGLCLGLLKINNLFFEEEITFDEESFLFLFSDGIETDSIINALSAKADKLFLDQKNLNNLNNEIFEYILSKGTQKDDIILVCLNMPKIKDNPLHYEFLSSYEGVDKACEWIKKNLTMEKIPLQKDRDLILLALREALLNAVEHGNNYNPKAYVDLSLIFDPDKLRINISDEGSGFNLSQKNKDLENLSNIRIGGRGLPLMQLASDSIEINGGTISLIFNVI